MLSFKTGIKYKIPFNVFWLDDARGILNSCDGGAHSRGFTLVYHLERRAGRTPSADALMRSLHILLSNVFCVL